MEGHDAVHSQHRLTFICAHYRAFGHNVHTMNRRLDSWKAIAEYLGRDAATARRWEKTLGLPVQRVAGGAGRSVFTYTAEIDAWLRRSRSVSHILMLPTRGPAGA